MCSVVYTIRRMHSHKTYGHYADQNVSTGTPSSELEDLWSRVSLMECLLQIKIREKTPVFSISYIEAYKLKEIWAVFTDL